MFRRVAADIVVILTTLTVTGAALRSQPVAGSQTVLRSTAEEVLLDLIARDKHHKLITNLHAEDIEILEDGVPQTLRSFRYATAASGFRGTVNRSKLPATDGPMLR